MDSDGQFYSYADGTPYNASSPAFDGVYTLSTKDGLAYTIDGNSGKLLTATDANGNTLTFTDAGITSSAGPQVTFDRDPQGRIVAVTDPAGNKVQYQYDASGNLIAVTDRAGQHHAVRLRRDAAALPDPGHRPAGPHRRPHRTTTPRAA